MLLRAIALCLFSFFPLQLFAQDCDSNTDATQCTVQGEWQFNLAMGAGFRANPLHGGHNIPLWLMPDLSYYGERLFFDNGTLGFSLMEHAQWQLSMVSRINEEVGYFRRRSAANVWQQSNFIGSTLTGPTEKYAAKAELSISDLDKRPLALDAGTQLDWQWSGLQWRFNWWHDISSQYDGQHLKLGTAYTKSHWSGIWTVGAGLAWKDKQLMNTYYGVNDLEGNGLSYQASASWQPEVALHWQYPLNDRWQLLSLVRYRWLNSHGQSNTPLWDGPSPLLRDSIVRSWFVGLSYRIF